MPKKSLRCEHTEEGWLLSGTSYDKRLSIKLRLDGVWRRGQQAWLIPVTEHTQTASQVLQRYKKLPYDVGSRSAKQQVRLAELREQKCAHQKMVEVVCEWMERHLSSLPPTTTLHAQSVSYSHNSYYFLSGPITLVQQEKAKDCYQTVKRYEADEQRGMALAILYRDTS